MQFRSAGAGRLYSFAAQPYFTIFAFVFGLVILPWQKFFLIPGKTGFSP